MTVIINPGSGDIAESGVGWTNTREGAIRAAAAWLNTMQNEGYADIEATEVGPVGNGRWAFDFRHSVTCVVVQLETHGIDDLDAFMAQSIFPPRVYWNGSSSSNPSMDDFAAPGFVMTFRRAS